LLELVNKLFAQIKALLSENAKLKTGLEQLKRDNAPGPALLKK